MANRHPVILCHGLFGWGRGEAGGYPYWGTARTVPRTLPLAEVNVGPVSSTHDRACEMAFQIRGGTVDYGQVHADAEGHDRKGRTYPGFHPAWSASRPVHLVGHSMGAPTIRMLQHLLAIDYFGWGSSADWVTSLSCISGVLNGSTATYFLGCDEDTGLVVPNGISEFVGRAVELHLRISGRLFDDLYDFDLDHWHLAMGPRDPLLAQIHAMADSPLFRGRDNAAYSLTIQGLLDQNARCATHPNTHYFSYVTEQTTIGALTPRHYPEPLMNPFLIPSSLFIGHRTFSRPFYPGFDSSDWWHNDGLVSVYSQMFPRTAGSHPIEGPTTGLRSFERGAWYYEMVDSTDHIDIVALPELWKVGLQRRFYIRLFERLAAL